LFHGTTRARPEPAAPHGDAGFGRQDCGQSELLGLVDRIPKRPRRCDPPNSGPHNAREAEHQAGQADQADQAVQPRGPTADAGPQGDGRSPTPQGDGPTADAGPQGDGRSPTPQRERCQPCPPTQADPTARFPNAKLRGWIAARDTTCRAPGCTAPARSCDVDHTANHAVGGLTRHDNLGLVCRHHHRLKHEGGFRLEQLQPGQFRWTSPTGHVYDVPPDPP
jgi:hypothetical protein